MYSASRSRNSLAVTPRKRCVSRNLFPSCRLVVHGVAPRKRRVSRNDEELMSGVKDRVAPRKRRVSRNTADSDGSFMKSCRASQEACE